MSMSDLQNYLRELERRQRQAIDRYNQEVRRYNENVKRTVEEHNRKVVNAYNQGVKRVNDNIRRSVDDYNREVRAHNSRVMANRQRLQTALQNLNRQPVTTRYVTFRTSVESVNRAYSRLDQQPGAHLGANYARFVDLSEREAANSVEVMNSLLGSPPSPDGPPDQLENSQLTDELRKMSPDLDRRWQGAVYALNPRNPDAARHFCTSAREIVIQILDTHAPDAEVFELLPDCDRTELGSPTRRAKVKFFLRRKGLGTDALEDFVEKDIENIVQLFRVFNEGTHGSAGAFGFAELNSIRKRVEDGIFFLSSVIH
jgi:Predicted pPIWI-associating nuclease